jgi:hypothetical protein
VKKTKKNSFGSDTTRVTNGSLYAVNVGHRHLADRAAGMHNSMMKVHPWKPTLSTSTAAPGNFSRNEPNYVSFAAQSIEDRALFCATAVGCFALAKHIRPARQEISAIATRTLGFR